MKLITYIVFGIFLVINTYSVLACVKRFFETGDHWSAVTTAINFTVIIFLTVQLNRLSEATD